MYEKFKIKKDKKRYNTTIRGQDRVSIVSPKLVLPEILPRKVVQIHV